MGSQIENRAIDVLPLILSLAQEVAVGTFNRRIYLSCNRYGTFTTGIWTFSSEFTIDSRNTILQMLEKTHEFSHTEQITKTQEGSIFVRKDNDSG